MRYRRLPIEIESPEQFGYERIRFNLAESSVRDAVLGDLGEDVLGGLRDLVLQYGDHRGLPSLRARIAADVAGATDDDVLLTPGAAAALFIVQTSLLSAGDHVVVIRPNYATNVETPRAIGADVTYVDLAFEDGWRVDPDRIRDALTPRTALVSVTTPGNPTGALIEEEDLRQLVAIVEAHPVARLLVDETYRELAFDDPAPAAAGLSPRAISVASLSKAYGLPGIRMGWLVTRDRDLGERLLAAKEQIVITNSVVDEALADEAVARAADWLPGIRAKAREARTTVEAWLARSDAFEWVTPRGGVVGFVRFRPGGGTRSEDQLDRFYTALLERHGTVVGPGHWFEQSRSSFRLGFGWPTPEELSAGLVGLEAAADEA